MPSANSQIAALEAQVSELRQTVDALTAEQDAAREQARQVVRPISMNGNAAANAAEKAQKEDWRKRMGYGAAPALKPNIPQALESHRRKVEAALKAERDEKAASEALRRSNAARRAALVESGEYVEAQRTQSVAADLRQIERERHAGPNPYTVKAPIVVDATGVTA